MKGTLVLWIGLALIVGDLVVTKQGSQLWALLTQPSGAKPTSAPAASAGAQLQTVMQQGGSTLGTLNQLSPVVLISGATEAAVTDMMNIIRGTK